MLNELTVKEFSEKVSGNEAVPGGGSVSALAAALSASLVEMVCNLSLNKKGFEEHNEKALAIIGAAKKKRGEFLDGIDKDAESFEAVMNAFKLPKDSAEQKILRSEAIERAFKTAAAVPYQLAAGVLELKPHIEFLKLYGNKNALSDVLVAEAMMKASVKGAIENVKINLGSIKDQTFVKDYEKKTEQIINAEINF